MKNTPTTAALGRAILPRTPYSRSSETPRTDAALDKNWTILDESLENVAKVSKELERENKTLWMAGYSARYILEDLNNEPGMWQMAKLTGLPMGVIVEAFANIFAGSDDSSESADVDASVPRAHSDTPQAIL
jgi:hypothetical protein